MSFPSTPGPLPPDVSRGSDLLIVRWLTMSIAVLLVSLRFYIRGILRKSLGWDDYTILLAMALAIAQSIVTTFQVQSGFGRNIQYLTPVQIQHVGLYTSICIMLLTIGTGLVRVSVCLFVLRLVPATMTSYRRWIWGFLTFYTIITLVDFLAQCFHCIPLPGLWDQSIKARCFAESAITKIFLVWGVSAVITDLLCVLLPILVFRNLQVSLREKLAIFVMIGLGFFTAATAIVKMALSDFTTKNFTWEWIPVAIWACLEQNIGITVASMPALRQLLTIRRRSCPIHSSENCCNHHNNHHNNNNRPPLNPFVRLSESDRIRLPDGNSSSETSSLELSSLAPEKSDIESRHDTRASHIRLSLVSPPLWAERKISSAEKVEMSRVSPTPTLVERKPSSAEKVRLSMVSPSWGHRKTSSADKANTRNQKGPSIVSPLSVDRPPSPFSAGKMQQLGRFDESSLRTSRVATPEEMMTLGNPAAVGYSCKIEGGTPKGSPKTSPKPSPKLTP